MSTPRLSYAERSRQVLAALRRRPNATAAQLAEECHCSRATVNAILNRLEDEGLVERTGYGRQRRIVGAVMKAPEVNL